MVMYILVLSVCLFYLNGMTLTEAAGYEWVIRGHSLCTEFRFIILFTDIMSVLHWTVSNHCVSFWVHYNFLAHSTRHRRAHTNKMNKTRDQMQLGTVQSA